MLAAPSHVYNERLAVMAVESFTLRVHPVT